MSAIYNDDTGGHGCYHLTEDGVSMQRHAAGCKPGTWELALPVPMEVHEMFQIPAAATWGVTAVVDDFGNLVRVSQ